LPADPAAALRECQPARCGGEYADSRAAEGTMTTVNEADMSTVLPETGAQPLPEAGLQAETGYRFARRFGVLPDQLRDGRLDVFAARLRDRYERSANDAMQFVEGLGEDADLMSVAQSLAEPEDLLESQDEAPIIRLINALLSEAVKENASDIHIEPFENRLSIRLRVDGVLREVLEPPRALAPVIVSRIKVMAKLDIAEKRLPQDGRIGLRLVGRAVDVRVS